MTNNDGVLAGSRADFVKRLTNMYWSAAAREVQNMILFYREAIETQGSLTASSQVEVNLLGDNFRKMFKLWSKSACSGDYSDS